VYVTNLPYTLTEAELQTAFIDKGYRVKEVSLGFRRYDPTLNVGYGFVEFISSEEQARVLKEIPRFSIKGRDCAIVPARPVPSKTQSL
jgi:RNA recognition motif-containing protein